MPFPYNLHRAFPVSPVDLPSGINISILDLCFEIDMLRHKNEERWWKKKAAARRFKMIDRDSNCNRFSAVERKVTTVLYYYVAVWPPLPTDRTDVSVVAAMHAR